MAKFGVTLSIGLAGADRYGKIEVPDEDLENLTEEERRREILEHVQGWADRHISIDFDEVKE